MANEVFIDNLQIVTTGKLLKIARVKGQWFEEIDDVDKLVEKIKKSKLKADIFTFFQKVPYSKPFYKYYWEYKTLAVIPIKSYDNWFKNQIKKNTRQAVKKANKFGVQIKIVEFDDELLKGIHAIYNETKLRQGKLYPHFGKDLKTIKNETGTYMDRSIFIGAYYENELIGFIKLVREKDFMDILAIISKIKHRDKNPTNALLAKAIEVCEYLKMPWISYGWWARGGLNAFKRHNGFEKFDVPMYYIPTTLKGYAAVKLKLHHGVKGLLPESTILRLIDVRNKMNKIRYNTKYFSKN